MNKKGQTLILFVILIPIIVTMMAVVVDIGLIQNKYLKTREIIELGIKEYYKDSNVTSLKNILKINDISLENVNIIEENNQIEIVMEDKIDALFGKIIGLKNYPMKVHVIGKKENNKIIVTKKE